MKQLILIRHAKSSWNDFSIKDFDRPLNDRGKKDAPAMAQRLIERKISIDGFLSSPANRAASTAEYFIKEYDRKKAEIIFRDELYLASTAVFFDVIASVDDQFKTIAVFSHNEGITDFANHLTTTRIDELPTCGIFAVNIDTKSWADFRNATREFLFFISPKVKD